MSATLNCADWAETSAFGFLPTISSQELPRELPTIHLDLDLDLDKPLASATTATAMDATGVTTKVLVAAPFADAWGSLDTYLAGASPSPGPGPDDGVVPVAPTLPGFATAATTAAAASPLVHNNNKRALDARWTEELLTMEQHAFRKWLKKHPMPAADEDALKKARRRAKNRSYAKKARTKRIARQSNLVENHSSLKMDNARLTREVRDISDKLEAELAAKARIVRFLELKCGPEEAARLLAHEL